METDNFTHIGRKIERIRILKGIKQGTLAVMLNTTQSTVSKIEQSKTIDDEMLEKISKALGVPVEAIQNFNEERAINIFSNTFTDFKDNAIASAMNFQCTFNAIDKLMEAVDDNKKLYERMLETERSKVKLLEDLLKSKQQEGKR